MRSVFFISKPDKTLQEKKTTDILKNKGTKSSSTTTKTSTKQNK
jgi:hypothetical protein